MEEKRDTVGKISSDLIVKPLESETPFEQMSEQLSDWDKNVLECIDRHRKLYDGDFYLVVISKKEKLMQNVIRNYFLATKSCPTPTWDQTVFFYDRKDEAIDYLWTVPDKATCTIFSLHPTLIPPDQYQLLHFVQKFQDGTLLNIAKQRNGETETPPIIIIEPEGKA